MRQTKSYPIEKSPLFRIRSKTKLAELLEISRRELTDLVKKDCYAVFLNEVGREIQQPIGRLRIVHEKIQKFLSRIESPTYLFSGKKKLSYLDNALKHINGKYVLVVDIKRFYPNCKEEFVFRFFRYRLEMSEDVAWLLTRLVCYNDFIPTGSPLSQSIAFWSCSKTFDSIYKMAKQLKMDFSLYVDDMTFSSVSPIPKDFHLSISYHLKRIGLRLKNSKIKYFSKNDFKLITGTAISPQGIPKISNKLQQKILKGLRKEKNIHNIDPKKRKVLLGQIVAARRIEPKFLNEVYTLLKTA